MRGRGEGRRNIGGQRIEQKEGIGRKIELRDSRCRRAEAGERPGAAPGGRAA